MPRFTPNCRPVSDLVVRVEGLAILVGATTGGVRLNELSPDLQMLSYVVSHEFGHSRDYFERPKGIDSTRKLVNGFKISTWAEVNSAIAFSEYAACVFSAEYVSEALMRYQFDSDSESIERLLVEIHDRRRAYTNDSELYELATKTCMEFWFVIIQAAKLFGQRRGNPALRAVSLDWSKWLPGIAFDLLPNLELALVAAWERYPDCASDFLRECRFTWNLIAQAEGFQFEEGDDGDGVFFSRYTLSDIARGFPMPARHQRGTPYFL